MLERETRNGHYWLVYCLFTLFRSFVIKIPRENLKVDNCHRWQVSYGGCKCGQCSDAGGCVWLIWCKALSSGIDRDVESRVCVIITRIIWTVILTVAPSWNISNNRPLDYANNWSLVLKISEVVMKLSPWEQKRVRIQVSLTYELFSLFACFNCIETERQITQGE